ncbi:hypothetical protein CVT24_003319 [Panaeolus cyanescens]|uniref:Uncharacterized protein n=1 Tax=Panaeolus cyanescens TaxID=181874 RepID=A0A409Y6M1_9AGAR|nr:hypothetical protein CVT24_003319 [Panaeolus cyanescens]
MHHQKRNKVDESKDVSSSPTKHSLRDREKKVESDKASVLTQDSDIPVWCRDGSDETLGKSNSIANEADEALRKNLTKEATEKDGDIENYEFVDSDESDDFNELYSPISSSSTLIDTSSPPPAGASQPLKVEGYSNLKEGASKVKKRNEREVYRRRLQQWMSANSSAGLAGPSSTSPALEMCTKESDKRPNLHFQTYSTEKVMEPYRSKLSIRDSSQRLQPADFA